MLVNSFDLRLNIIYSYALNTIEVHLGRLPEEAIRLLFYLFIAEKVRSFGRKNSLAICFSFTMLEF